MKTDRMQGIIINTSAPTHKTGLGRKTLTAKYFKHVPGFSMLGTKNSKAQQRHIKIEDDYTRLVASELFERLHIKPMSDVKKIRRVL